MPAINVNGAQLEYIERGEGEPLVLSHGTLGDYRSWQLQLRPFAQRYRVIAYSRRYHHPNACRGNESDYSATLHADDLAALITGLGLESAHVVGNSYGAYTALFLAARHPQRVRALVLSEPPVLPLLERTADDRALRDDFLDTVCEPAGEMMRHGQLEEGVRVFIDGVVEEGAFDRFSRGVHQLIMDNTCEFKVETSSPDFWTPFTCDDASGIETPTLLLVGEHSVTFLQRVVDELQRCLPNNECVRVPDSTHELPSGRPELYNQAVLDFLAQYDR